MAQASKRQRQMRRLKRRISLSNRHSKIIGSKLTEANHLLLGVLAQSGGEVTVTTGTLEQIVKDFAHMAWVVEKGRADNELVVKLVSDGLTEADKETLEQTTEAGSL